MASLLVHRSAPQNPSPITQSSLHARSSPVELSGVPRMNYLPTSVHHTSTKTFPATPTYFPSSSHAGATIQPRNLEAYSALPSSGTIAPVAATLRCPTPHLAASYPTTYTSALPSLTYHHTVPRSGMLSTVQVANADQLTNSLTTNRIWGPVAPLTYYPSAHLYNGLMVRSGDLRQIPLDCSFPPSPRRKKVTIKRHGPGCCGECNSRGGCDRDTGTYRYLNCNGCCDRERLTYKRVGISEPPIEAPRKVERTKCC